MTNDDFIELRKDFKDHLVREFSVENYLFFNDTRNFHRKYTIPDAEKLGGPNCGRPNEATDMDAAVAADVLRIYETYLSSEALDEVGQLQQLYGQCV